MGRTTTLISRWLDADRAERSDANFTDRHRRLLSEIGGRGIEPESLSRESREFEDLERQEMLVFWPVGARRPRNAYGEEITPGRWCLTLVGADEIGLRPPAVR